MWLNEFKKAVILQDLDSINDLLNSLPAFNTIDEMEEAAYLMQQALLLSETEKAAALIAMQQIKNTLDFLKSTESSLPSTLNLKL